MTDENKDYHEAASGQPLALERREAAADGRRYSPSIGRNRDVVRETYLAHMPTRGQVLEIASGTGEHGAHITAAAADLTWIYSDIDAASQASQQAWRDAADHDRLRGPLTLDVTTTALPNPVRTLKVGAIFCANMVHIAPFAATHGLISVAGQLLAPQGRLMLYGPFARDGKIAPSNARFSDDLKRRDPRWGVRDLEREIVPLAEAAGLFLNAVIEMPANNLSVVFVRR
ncbi:MAG: DUF938 domain-containing protein [Pseudomonadota bacterium]|nr:DUF938 domain-containing protein [Pseudomonadota bacterium]